MQVAYLCLSTLVVSSCVYIVRHGGTRYGKQNARVRERRACGDGWMDGWRGERVGWDRNEDDSWGSIWVGRWSGIMC